MSINFGSNIQRQRQAVQFRGAQDAQQAEGQNNGGKRAAIVAGSTAGGAAIGAGIAHAWRENADTVAKGLNENLAAGANELLEKTGTDALPETFTNAVKSAKEFAGEIFENADKKKEFKFGEDAARQLGDKASGFAKVINGKLGDGLSKAENGKVTLVATIGSETKKAAEGVKGAVDTTVEKIKSFAAKDNEGIKVLKDNLKPGVGKYVGGAVVAGLAALGIAALATRSKKAPEGAEQQ